ncbi:MAG: CDP-alcohol phosphatidyltransferase family protein [Tumebacillaceae bacterium]
MSVKERYREIESVTKYSNYYLGKCYTWLSIPITDMAARMGLHPNAMTLISLVLALIACWFYWLGDTTHLIVGSVILYISYVLDWCDGQLARFTGKMSPFGGWLDQMCDRTKEFLYVSTLAGGYFRLHGDVSVFGWAMGALFFLFLLEYYGQMNRAIPTAAVATETVADSEPATPVMGRPTGNRRKIVIDFSIDEQYAFIVLAVILLGAKWALVATVLVAALFAIYKPMKAWKHYFTTK